MKKQRCKDKYSNFQQTLKNGPTDKIKKKHVSGVILN